MGESTIYSILATYKIYGSSTLSAGELAELERLLKAPPVYVSCV